MKCKDIDSSAEWIDWLSDWLIDEAIKWLSDSLIVFDYVICNFISQSSFGGPVRAATSEPRFTGGFSDSDGRWASPGQGSFRRDGTSSTFFSSFLILLHRSCHAYVTWMNLCTLKFLYLHFIMKYNFLWTLNRLLGGGANFNYQDNVETDDRFEWHDTIKFIVK